MIGGIGLIFNLKERKVIKMKRVLKSIGLLAMVLTFPVIAFAASGNLTGVASAHGYGHGNNYNRYHNYYRGNDWHRNVGNRWSWYRYNGHPYRVMYYDNNWWYWNDNDNYWYNRYW